MTRARFPIDSERPGWNSDSHADGIARYRFRYYRKAEKLRRSQNRGGCQEEKKEDEREVVYKVSQSERRLSE